jgi:hypothetical protein
VWWSWNDLHAVQLAEHAVLRAANRQASVNTQRWNTVAMSVAWFWGGGGGLHQAIGEKGQDIGLHHLILQLVQGWVSIGWSVHRHFGCLCVAMHVVGGTYQRSATREACYCIALTLACNEQGVGEKRYPGGMLLYRTYPGLQRAGCGGEAHPRAQRILVKTEEHHAILEHNGFWSKQRSTTDSGQNRGAQRILVKTEEHHANATVVEVGGGWQNPWHNAESMA